jgi:hypothetical protein
MSGGAFDYKQYHLDTLAEDINQAIRDNDKEYRGYSEDTLTQFRDAVFYLKLAAVYVQRIDWLLSGDDGEDTFHQRLDDEISALVP